MPVYHLADARDELRRRIREKANRLVPHHQLPKRRRKPQPVAAAVYDAATAVTVRKNFFAEVMQAAKVRIALLDGKQPRSEMACPWLVHFGEHDDGCRCAGRGQITVAQYRRHLERVIETYTRFA